MAATRLSALAIALSFSFGTSMLAAAAWDPFFTPPTTVGTIGDAARPFGVAAGDFDSDGKVDLVIGRTTGHVAFAKGNGDGTFQMPVAFPWKLAYYNAWAFAAADVNSDGKLDLVWGANASSPGTAPFAVNDGDVRVFHGNGDGTFVETPYFINTVRHNAGALLADVGTDAGSLAAADVDADGDADLAVGAIDGANTTIKLLRNQGGGVFTSETLLAQPTTAPQPDSPVYYPAMSTQNSPWGLALGDADGDGDADLWVGDRALYVYLLHNDGAGTFAMRTGNSAVSERPNVYLGHDTFRAAVGYTPALASADVNGDGKADLVLGLHSGAQTPTNAVAHDGVVLLDLSAGGGHVGFGALADLGTVARGLVAIDADGDTYADIVAATYEGAIKLLRQLPPLDSDNDGLSEYVDNAPGVANAPRIDMNIDGSINHHDQLDNDADTILGNPELPGTWVRLGDPVDPDDDNDGVEDAIDNCPFVANPDQANVDGDAFGTACDPLDDRDADNDGVRDGPLPGDAWYTRTRDAKIKWSSGSTRFVIRIDALGRFFQNEFTQLMTDAAVLSPAEWETKCWEDYEPDDIGGYQPCGAVDVQSGARTLTLAGGKAVPVSVFTIPKQLWTDPPVVAWINDRNDNPRFEIAQHGTYHGDNTLLGDWRNMPDRNRFSCEACGLTEAESFELMKVGWDTLLGNYGNPWIAQSGATSGSPKIDWSSSAHPLISFAPPYNTSDPTARKAVAQFGFKAFSASVFEEDGYPGFSEIFSPEGGHHERFDQFGMFHVSADVQLDPPDTSGDTYDVAAYDAHLRAKTNSGGLTTWLIEEVEWSGRPCNNDDRLGTCNGGSNRENNTVYLPRWNAWLQLLDFVKTYPGGVALTTADVALAQAYDNAPTVANPDQADSDLDGIGDAIEGAAISPLAAKLTRNLTGSLEASLKNGAGTPLQNQRLTFGFDQDGDGTEETFEGLTNAAGIASVTVMPSRTIGDAPFSVSWDGMRLTATANGMAAVGDLTTIALDTMNPASGQTTDAVTVAATLIDSSGTPLVGHTVTFTIGDASGVGITDPAGRASATLVLSGPATVVQLQAAFAGDALRAPAAAVTAFSVLREDTSLVLTDAVARKREPAIAAAVLREPDGQPLAGKTIVFSVEEKVRGTLAWTMLGVAVTDAGGRATFIVPTRYVAGQGTRRIRAAFVEDSAFTGSTGLATASRQ